MTLPFRIVWSLWGHGSGGLGLGLWRSRGYGGDPAIWTVAIGPLSIYIRKLAEGES